MLGIIFGGDQLLNKYPSAPFESTGKLEYENGPFHDNICIGQYGVNTLRPERDIMKQTGSSDGWFADWLCKKFDWFNSSASSMSDCKGTESSEKNNGNREYLDFTFPFLMEVRSIKLQGIREIITGGRKYDRDSNNFPDVPIPPIGPEDPVDWRGVKIPLRSYINTFEVWCNDGLDWWTIEDYQWKKAEDVLNFSDQINKAWDNRAFNRILKF